jgi:hypothetical protein
MLLGGVSIVSIRAAGAGNVQFMLYVTLPLSSRGSSSLPLYGLRIGQFRKRPTTPQLVAIAPSQRELIDVQISGHSDVRVALGRRLIWNFPRGAFGPQSNPAVFTIGVPIKGSRLSDEVNQELWDPGTLGVSALAGAPIRTRQVDSEIIAIVNLVIPLHWTASDGRPPYMQLRPTIRFGNSQPTAALRLSHNAETH